MGINGLGPYLRKKTPEAFKEVPLSNYANKRVAIDISLYLYKYKVVFGDNGWLSGMINLVTTLRKWKIEPVIVYDGDAPVEKLEEQQRRRTERKKRETKIEDYQDMVSIYHKTGEIATELQEFYDKHKKKVENQNLLKLLGTITEKVFDIKTVETKLEDMASQNVRMFPEDITLSMNMFKTLGIPYVQAPNEAEAYCSFMCMHGQADAVLTEDTDVLCYGTNKLLTKINTQKSTVVEIDLDMILEGLEFEFKQFRDFCILLGCDYNSRPKGFGPVKCFNTLTEYKTIEEIEDNVKTDMSCSKYVRSRELFDVPDSIEYVYIPCVSPDKIELERFLFENRYRGFSSGVYTACVKDDDPSKDTIKPETIESVYVPRRSPSKDENVRPTMRKLLPLKRTPQKEKVVEDVIKEKKVVKKLLIRKRTPQKEKVVDINPEDIDEDCPMPMKLLIRKRTPQKEKVVEDVIKEKNVVVDINPEDIDEDCPMPMKRLL